MAGTEEIGTKWKKAKTRWHISSYTSTNNYVSKHSSFWLTSVEASDMLHTAITKLIHDHPGSRCVDDSCSKCERKGWHEKVRDRNNKRV